jgi:hypothetical protein
LEPTLKTPETDENNRECDDCAKFKRTIHQILCMQGLGVLLVAGAGIFIVWHENGNQKVLMEWLLFLLRERENMGP